MSNCVHRTMRCTVAAASSLVLVTVVLSLLLLPAAPASAVAPSLTLSASGATNTSVSLSWILRNSTASVRYYWVTYGPDGESTGGSKNVGTAKATTITGLDPGTWYWFQVKGSTTGGLIASNTITVKTTGAPPLPPTPAAPSDLTTTVVSASRIDLQWTDNSSNETGFRVELAAGEAGPYTQIATVGTGVTSYSCAGLDEATTYYFRVCAGNAGGDSAYSNIAFATTPATTPAAPGTLTATPVSASRIELRWSDNSSNEQEFCIERAGSPTGPFTQVAVVGTGVTSYSDPGLAESTTYYYRVYAANSAGNSEYSITASATTPATIPAGPSGLTASAVSTSRIDLRWTDNSFNETGFRIERAPSAGGTFTQVATVAPDITAYSNTGLPPATTYFYRVCACNSAGDSGYSAASAATKAPVPAAPSNLAASTTSSSRIDLSWADNSSDETGFKVERGPTAAGPFQQIAVLGAGATSYSHTGLAASTTYFYHVCASSAAGDSAYSNTASATTPGTAPDAPGSLAAAAVSTSRIDLSWADNSSNESGFKVLRTNPDSAVTTFVLPPDTTSYSDAGLSASTAYTYQVCAYNAIGTSAYAGPVSATTQSPPPMPPSAPEGLSASVASNSEIRLAWRDTAWNETGFIIERSTTAGSGFQEAARLGADTESYNDQGLSEGTAYYYRVCALNDDGPSGLTTTVSATTKLNAPSDLRASAFATDTVELAWTDNSTHEAHYVIERNTQSASGPWVVLATLAANTRTYSDQTCLPDTTYYYRVYATGSISDPSNVASVVTPETPGDPGEPLDPHWIGKTPVVGDAYWAAMSGSYAYVTSSTGMQVVDISDPANPLVTGSMSMTFPYDLTVGADGCVYACDGKSLKVVDVQNPADPEVVATLAMPDYAQGVCVSGARAYVACYTAGVIIVDITNPYAPRELGRADTPGGAFSVAVSGSTAIVADATSVLALDVTNPASPSIRGTVATSDRAVDVCIENGYAYVAASTAGMLVVDVKNPASMQVVGVGRPTVFGSASGVTVSGGRAYVASFSYNTTDNGLQVFDASNPAQPAQTAFLPVSGRTRGGIAQEGSIVCIASGSGGFNVIDASAPGSPRFLDRMPETLQSRSVAADGDWLYALSYSSVQSRLVVFDASNPALPVQAGSVDLAYPFDVALDGSGWAYVGDGKSLKVVDVHVPSAPVVAATLAMPDYAQGVCVSGARAYVACYMAGVVIVDISNPYAPKVIGTADTPGGAFAVAVSGSTAIVADATSVVALDVTNPAAAVTIGSVATSDRAVDVAVEGGYAYVAASTAGMLVLDLSSLQIVGVGRPTLFGSASGVTVSGGRAFVASFSYNTTDNGLQVFDASNPAQPAQVSFLQSPGRYCKTAAVSGRAAYLTDDRHLVQVAGF